METILSETYIFDVKDFNGKNKNGVNSFVESYHFCPEYSIKYWLKCLKKDDKLHIYFYVKSPVDIIGNCRFIFETFDIHFSNYTFKSDKEYGAGSGFSKLPENFETLFKTGKMKVELFASLKLSIKPRIKKPISEMLFEDDETSDFTIICKNGRLNVHKNILAFSSPVFKAMFEHDCQEKKDCQVTIDDVDFEVIKIAVHLMYKRRLPKKVDVETMLGVHVFADRYDMKDKDVIIKWIKKFINDENVCELTKYAIDEHLDEVSNLCINYMANDVTNVANFKNFNDLSFEISFKILKKAAENNSEIDEENDDGVKENDESKNDMQKKKMTIQNH